jgi:hypothetical protein
VSLADLQKFQQRFDSQFTRKFREKYTQVGLVVQNRGLRK